MSIKYIFFSFFLVCCSANIYAQQKPNIIIIISDDHAYQAIGAYGNKFVKTPGIDRIANEGVRFDDAFVNNSLCGPSRAAMLTGKYSHVNGFLDNEHSKFNFSQDSFAKELQKNGYQTAWIGKMHLINQPQGFDYYSILPDQGNYYNPSFIEQGNKPKKYEGYVTNIITQKAEKWLDERNRDKPFCLVIGHKATHRIWAPDTADLGKYDGINFPIPANFYDTYENRAAAKEQKMSVAKNMIMGYDLKMNSLDEEKKAAEVSRMNAKQKAAWDKYYQPIKASFVQQKLSGKALAEWKFERYMRDYLTTAAALDRNIAETLDYLDKNNLTKNTIVIYLSDQGFYLGEHGWFDKRFMYEESFKTPFVMRYPGVIKPHTVSKNMIMNIDIAPTLLQAAGAKIPADMQGESILPLLKAKPAKGRDAVYYHYYEGRGEHNVSPQFGVRTSRYKLIRFYDQVNSWELYDLQKDPHEMNNIFGKKQYAAITKKLKQKLKELITKYKDFDAEKWL